MLHRRCSWSASSPVLLWAAIEGNAFYRLKADQAERVRKWETYQDFFAKMDMSRDYPLTVEIWDEALIYAAAFGYAKKVITNMPRTDAAGTPVVSDVGSAGHWLDGGQRCGRQHARQHDLRDQRRHRDGELVLTPAAAASVAAAAAAVAAGAGSPVRTSGPRIRENVVMIWMTMTPPIQLSRAGQDADRRRPDRLRRSLPPLGAGQLVGDGSRLQQDKIDWNEKFDDFMRKAARWNYSLFFFGEDEVADQLSPFIDAAPLEEQKYFLTTQQVDEARHAIFFSRFFKEVIGVERRELRRPSERGRRRSDLRNQEGLRSARTPSPTRCARGDHSKPEARAGGRAVPLRRRGHARADRPALHRRLPRPHGRPARLPRGHGERREGRAAPHRLRREAARRPQPSGPRGQAGGARDPRQGHAVRARRVPSAERRRALHRGLRRDDARRRRDRISASSRCASAPPASSLRPGRRAAVP